MVFLRTPIFERAQAGISDQMFHFEEMLTAATFFAHGAHKYISMDRLYLKLYILATANRSLPKTTGMLRYKLTI